MYKVIAYFVDLQDNNHPYNVGDTFPRDGLEVKPERIAELSGKHNKRGTPLIELAQEQAPAGDSIEAKTVEQLKEYAASKGIDLGNATKKAEIIAKIKEAEAAEN